MPFRPELLRLLAPAALAVSTLVLASIGGGAGDTARPHPAAAAAGGLSVPDCIKVETGESFDVSINVSDVEQLLAWDILYAYNPAVLEVTDRDVRRLLEALPQSSVFDLSDPLPNRTGTYRIGAADTGGTAAAESGSGILATVTLQANKKGHSWSAVYRGDVDGNGTIDIGPTLSALGGVHIGDDDGDGIFDGAISVGQIAVDTECMDPVPTPPPPRDIVVGPNPNATSVSLETTSPGDPTPSPLGGGASLNTTTPTPAGDEPRSPTPTRVIGNPPRVDNGGGSGLPLSTWLMALLAGSVALGVVFSYILIRTARRTA